MNHLDEIEAKAKAAEMPKDIYATEFTANVQDERSGCWQAEDDGSTEYVRRDLVTADLRACATALEAAWSDKYVDGIEAKRLAEEALQSLQKNWGLG